jgi:hypothetical protein
MPKRSLRLIECLGSPPVIGVCAYCVRQFRVPTAALSRTKDAQENMQQQFDRHNCRHEDMRGKFRPSANRFASSVAPYGEPVPMYPVLNRQRHGVSAECEHVEVQVMTDRISFI